VLEDKPDAVYIFGLGGANSLMMVKTWANRLKPAGIKFIGASQVEQSDMSDFGMAAIGVTSTTHYVEMANNPVNDALWKQWRKDFGPKPNYLPDLATCAAYDAMQLIYDAVAKLGPNLTGAEAIDFFKGKTFQSPRGSFTIDPKTRDIVQNIYVQRVEMKDGVEQNVPIDIIKNVKDPWKEAHPGE
jgi:branched-chain amino acid transport system substrate-binding protein